MSELLPKNDAVEIFQPLKKAPWGQRTIRFFNPDHYVIEVMEPMEEVVKNFLCSGMTEQEAAKNSMMPIEFVQKCSAEHSAPQTQGGRK